jgi:hypothetical protein
MEAQQACFPPEETRGPRPPRECPSTLERQRESGPQTWMECVGRVSSFWRANVAAVRESGQIGLAASTSGNVIP